MENKTYPLWNDDKTIGSDDFRIIGYQAAKSEKRNKIMERQISAAIEMSNNAGAVQLTKEQELMQPGTADEIILYV